MNRQSPITDNPYLWLEKKSKKVEEWLACEQKETLAYFSESKDTHNLKERFEKIFRSDSMRIPVYKKGYLFFRYKKSDEEVASLYMQKGLAGKPELLFNPSLLSKKDEVVINGWDVSNDANYVVFEFSKFGNDKNELRIFDVRKKIFLEEVIPETHYPYFQDWNFDSTGFWYMRRREKTKKGEEKYHKCLYFHKLGGSIKEDVVFFDKGLEKEDYPILISSHSARYITITVHKSDSNTRVYLYDIQDEKRIFLEVTKGLIAESRPYIENNFIYLYTDHNAPNGKILRREILVSGLGEWEEYISETSSKLESIFGVSGFLLLQYLVNASTKLYAIDIKTKKRQEIKLPDIGTISTFTSDYKTQTVFIEFSSFYIPRRIYRVNLKSFSIKSIWKSDIKIKENNYIILQEWYVSKDGTRIPMYIVHKKIIKRSGDNPTLVYAYGGFGHSITPEFYPEVLPFLEDGGIFVVVNIRGGGEFGKKWYKDAILKNKQKGFDDFSFALKFLTNQKYTNPNKIGIWGGSNGGLLMSVTMLQHPELYKTALIAVPVTDMLRFHLFDGGSHWISEYGNPNDKEMKKTLLKYSPYHNIMTKNYPSAMFITADKDDRVHPMHSFKMVARLKNNTAQKNKILLLVENDSGHSGSSLVTPHIKKNTSMFIFLYKELNIK